MAKPTGLNGNRKKPNENTAKQVQELAAKGHSLLNISKALGISKNLFYLWRDEYPEINEALELGKESERHDLHNALYTAAMTGNITSAIFLLKARHGYREGDQSDTANRVAITFNLPAAAQSTDDYLKSVSPAMEKLGDKTNDTKY